MKHLSISTYLEKQRAESRVQCIAKIVHAKVAASEEAASGSIRLVGVLLFVAEALFRS